MKPQLPLDESHHLLNRGRTVGAIALKSPHNEKPVGVFNVELLIEWLEAFQQFEDTVYVWEMEFPNGDDSDCLVATPSRDAKVGYAIAPIMEDLL